MVTTPSQTISIFNLDDQQRYDLPVRSDDPNPAWQWRPDGYWLSYQETSQVVKLIDIETGEVATGSGSQRDIVSPDGRYAARITESGDRRGLVTIVDLETGTETELVNPFLHLQSRDETFIESAWAVYWSPDGAYLSVLYDKHYYSDNFDRNLAIYTSSGEIARQYVDTDTSWENPWSPVAPYRILYMDGWTPCVLEMTENRSDCLDGMDEWLITQDVSPFHYIWSPDGDKISFVYHNSDQLKTGLCYVELATENVICPNSATDLLVDEQLFARIQYWSTDGNYLALYLDDVGIMDAVGPLRVAVIDISGQGFWLLEGEYSWPSSNPWRPPVTFNTVE